MIENTHVSECLVSALRSRPACEHRGRGILGIDPEIREVRQLSDVIVCQMRRMGDWDSPES